MSKVDIVFLVGMTTIILGSTIAVAIYAFGPTVGILISGLALLSGFSRTKS